MRPVLPVDWVIYCRVVACPQCNGGDRVPIAPGYWECTSMVTFREERWLPVGPGCQMWRSAHRRDPPASLGCSDFPS